MAERRGAGRAAARVAIVSSSFLAATILVDGLSLLREGTSSLPPSVVAPTPLRRALAIASPSFAGEAFASSQLAPAGRCETYKARPSADAPPRVVAPALPVHAARESRTAGRLASVQPLLERYGYLAVFAAIFVEGFGIPAPGQTLLIAAALLAAAGALSLPLLLTVAFTASTAGTLIGWAIGRWGGRRVLDRFSGPRLERLEDLCARRGGLLVAFGRFVDGARQLAGMLSGALGMPLGPFLSWNLLGGLVWTGVWGIGSFGLERNAGALADLYQRIGPVAAAAIVAVVVGTVVWLVRGRRRGARKV